MSLACPVCCGRMSEEDLVKELCCARCEEIHTDVVGRVMALREIGLALEANFLLHLYWKEDLTEDELNLDIADLSKLAKDERDYLRRCRQLIGASTKKPQSPRGLAKKTLALREAINAAFEGTEKPVTVRQMFYLLSTRDAVEKTEAGYRKVQRQLLAMRREDLIPYSWIADSTRWQRKQRSYTGIADCLEHTAAFYRQAVWHDVPIYIEVWCEKDALAGALYPETNLYDVPLMVARGYSSESFAYEAAENMREAINEGRACYVYYLGDFDPSGWHMSQDLERRLNGFLGANASSMHFERLAVARHQIDLWDLPNRPTKSTDTRRAGFEEEFGPGTPSVELDAIPPNRLRAMVREAIEQHLPEGWLERVEQEEQAARETLDKIKEWAA